MKRILPFLLLLILLWTGANPAQAQGLPDTASIPGVSGYAQIHNLSCESRSAADWAAFFSFSFSEDEILNQIPSSDNPDEGFVGNPNDQWGGMPPQSYGVHAAPVAKALQSLGVPAEAKTSLTWDDLRGEIAAGKPVIVWIIGQMWAGTPVEYSASDGTKAAAARFEHTMILYGYTPNIVQVVDAYTGLNLYFSLDSFLSSWSVLGNQAIVWKGEAPASTPPPNPTAEPTPDPTPTPAPTPITALEVHSGDTLLGLAEKAGVTWQDFVQTNSIKYPYFIYPGQILQLPPGVTLPPEVTAVPTSAPQPESTPAPQQPETYTVQNGDYLIELAERFKVDWLTLVDLNHIPLPYTIYPGQILQIR